MGQIIGYSKFKSKKGNDCCVLRILVEATERDNQYGHFGHIVQEVFVPEAQHKEISDSVVGKNATVNYTYYNGRGYVDSIIIK